MSHEYHQAALTSIINYTSHGYSHDRLLVNYIRYDNADIVEKILTHSSSVNPSANNNMAIQEAIRRDNIEMVELLISHKKFNADVLVEEGKTEQDLYNFPILSYSIVINRTNIARHLLLHHENIFNPAEHYNLPMLLAAKACNWEVIQLLLLYPQVDPSTTDLVPESLLFKSPYRYKLNLALNQAIVSGKMDIFLLLMNDSRFNSRGLEVSLDCAIEHHQPDIVRILMNNFNLDLNWDPHILAKACSKNDTDVIKALLCDKRINSNIEIIENALLAACNSVNVDTLQFLLNVIQIDESIISSIQSYCSHGRYSKSLFV